MCVGGAGARTPTPCAAADPLHFLRYGKELRGRWRLKKKESSPYFYFMDQPLDIVEDREELAEYMRADSAVELDVAMVMQAGEGARGVKPSLMMCNITNFL